MSFGEVFLVIGVFLREDCTQAVYGTVYKGSVQVVSCESFPSVLAGVSKGDFQGLVDVFKEVSGKFGVLYDEVYVSLPDSFFSMDCGLYEIQSKEEVPLPFLAQLLHADLTNYRVVMPFEFPKKTNRILTGCALKKVVIDGVVQAAREAKMVFALLEPASLSYLRMLSDWQEEGMVLEVFEKEASIVSYSPIAGAFKISLPEIAWQRVGELDSSNFNTAFRKAVTMCDATAQKTFSDLWNVDVPIHIISPYAKEIQKAISIQKRIVDYGVPTFKSDSFYKRTCFTQHDLTLEKFLEYFVPMGAVHFPIREVMQRDFD